MFNLPFFKRKYKIKPSVLVILDGFGIAPASQGNAISLAKTPYYKSLLSTYPHGELIASGESVGLPANEVGNTEVGHLTLGAGRTMLQELKRINLSIEKGTFFDNRALVALSNHCKSHGSKLHLMGLVSSGNVHSSFNHLTALLQFCKKEALKNVYLHIFTDGRDAPQKESVDTITNLQSQLKLLNLGKIASITGRYYAMDRDRRWERTEKTYKALVMGQGILANDPIEAINAAYARGKTDEFIEPTIISDGDGPVGTVSDGDGVIFFNYRIDRPRQLTSAFVLPNFENMDSSQIKSDDEIGKIPKNEKNNLTFIRGKVPSNLFFVTMTMYHKSLPVSAVAFAPEVVETPIGKIISDHGYNQIRMAESEKERFVTYYFNGLREERFPNEAVSIVPSAKVPTYDQKPEMSLPQLSREFYKEMKKDIYQFAVINLANPDMVAHSGNLQATVRAIEYVDKYLSSIISTVLDQDGTVFITADHGNSEELITFPSTTYFFTSNSGSVNTDHSNNPVPFVIVNNKLKGVPRLLPKGSLSDVTPTILAMMGIEKPAVMTGRNLFDIGTSKTKSEINN